MSPLVTSIERQFDRRLLFDHPDPYPFFAMLRRSQPVLGGPSAEDNRGA